MGTIGFGGIEEHPQEEEEGGSGGDDDADEERVWKEGSESIVFGRVGDVGLGVERGMDGEDDEEDEEVTPVMRILEELGSSLELSGGSTIGPGSVGSIRSQSRDTDLATLAESSVRRRNVSLTRASAPPPLYHSPAHSELLKIQQRHSSSSSSNQVRLKAVEDKSRKEETAKLKRKSKVVSGAVGALVLAVAGWRIFGSVPSTPMGERR